MKTAEDLNSKLKLEQLTSENISVQLDILKLNKLNKNNINLIKSFFFIIFKNSTQKLQNDLDSLEKESLKLLVISIWLIRDIF